MDYSLCDQVVTRYRKEENGVSRKVFPNAFFSLEEGFDYKERHPWRKFLLIIPGEEVSLQPGDRVLPGIGPEEVDWEIFLPILVSGLVEVGRTRNFQFSGKILHTEGEGAWN